MKKETKLKAASGSPIKSDWINSLHNKVPETAYQSLKLHAYPNLITMKQLRAEKEWIQQLARQAALQRALDYYLPTHKLWPKKDKPEEALRRVVFANWLDEHTEKEFEPLLWIGN